MLFAFSRWMFHLFIGNSILFLHLVYLEIFRFIRAMVFPSRNLFFRSVFSYFRLSMVYYLLYKHFLIIINSSTAWQCHHLFPQTLCESLEPWRVLVYFGSNTANVTTYNKVQRWLICFAIPVTWALHKRTQNQQELFFYLIFGDLVTFGAPSELCRCSE